MLDENQLKRLGELYLKIKYFENEINSIVYGSLVKEPLPVHNKPVKSKIDDKSRVRFKPEPSVYDKLEARVQESYEREPEPETVFDNVLNDSECDQNNGLLNNMFSELGD